jgi:hypothetical protein
MTGHDEELRLCRLEIARLSEENGLLRISSDSFGALAERLNNRLKVSEGAERPNLQTRVVLESEDRSS